MLWPCFALMHAKAQFNERGKKDSLFVLKLNIFKNREMVRAKKKAVKLVEISLLFLAPGCQYRVYPGPPSAITVLMDDWPEKLQALY